MKGQITVYYDKEGDYLEIMFGKPKDDYGDFVKDDVVLFRDQKDDEIIGIGIFNFTLNKHELHNVELALPVEINLSEISALRHS